MKRQYLQAGKIINTHGLKGDIKFEAWSDGLDFLDGVKKLYLSDDGTNVLYVEKIIKHGRFLLIKFKEIIDIDDALKYKNKILYVNRDDLSLDEGSFYISDLLGLDAIDQMTDKSFGKIVDVINRGASDIYVIKTNEGKEIMIPSVKEFVQKVDLELGVYFNLIEGFI